MGFICSLGDIATAQFVQGKNKHSVGHGEMFFVHGQSQTWKKWWLLGTNAQKNLRQQKDLDNFL